jgi:tetratricopeptide (TPR) repeat protein
MTEIGITYRDLGRLPEAREALTAATRCEAIPGRILVRPYYELALAEQALGKLPEARAKARKGLELAYAEPAPPGGCVPELLRVVGETSHELGDFGAAMEAFEKLADLFPETEPPHWRYLNWLALCQRELGQIGSARATAERVVQSPVPSEDDRDHARELLRCVDGDLAESHYTSGRYAECIVACESLLPKLTKKEEWYAHVLLLLAHSYVCIKKQRSARKYYEAVLACVGASTAQRAMAEGGLARLPKRWWF